MSPAQRTISMPVLLAGSIFIAVIFSACSDRVKTDINVYKALDESLLNSNLTIERQSQTEYASLEQKLTDPATSEKASIWQPKAMHIKDISVNIVAYIDSLKSDLKNEAGLKTDGTVESFRESDKNAVIRFFDRNRKGEELYKRLQKYKTDVLAIDRDIRLEFEKTILLTPLPENKQQDFTKTFFDDIPTIAALAMLSKFENNIRIIENRMVNFCNNKYSIMSIEWWPSPLVAQSISHVKAGETIEITAGIGSFTTSLSTEILVNRKKVLIDNRDGAAHYKFKASNQPGKYIVPVEISFVDQEGRKQWITKNVEYTVAN